MISTQHLQQLTSSDAFQQIFWMTISAMQVPWAHRPALVDVSHFVVASAAGSADKAGLRLESFALLATVALQCGNIKCVKSLR